MNLSKTKSLPVRRVMCATCPFRPGSPNTYLAGTLAESAVTEASRICHSSGSNNAFHHRTGKPSVLCRGARDVQLNLFFALGFLAAPTDAAWAAQRRKLPVEAD